MDKVCVCEPHPQSSQHDTHPTSDLHSSCVGYRIRISADAAQSLQRLLPPRLWTVFTATCARLRDDGHQLDAISGNATRWASGPPRGAAGQSQAYNADRTVLRNLLLSGVSEHVSFGMQFKGYSAAPDRLLSVDFVHHASQQTDLLIGADGVGSAVRRQRMPALGLLDTEGRAVFGKTPITPGFFDRIPRELGEGLGLIGESNDSKMKLFCDTMAFDRTNGAKAAQGLGISLPSDYLYWVLVFRRDAVNNVDLDKGSYPLTPEQSAKRSQELTAHWHPSIHGILTEQDPSATSSLKFHAAEPRSLMAAWKQDLSGHHAAVTLIGDAAHPMPPVGGFGANAAFQDAAALCDALCHGDDTTSRIRSYEQDMCFRAESVVQRSIQGSGRFFGMRSIEELQYADDH